MIPRKKLDIGWADLLPSLCWPCSSRRDLERLAEAVAGSPSPESSRLAPFSRRTP